jgi:hypothetical protein
MSRSWESRAIASSCAKGPKAPSHRAHRAASGWVRRLTFLARRAQICLPLKREVQSTAGARMTLWRRDLSKRDPDRKANPPCCSRV